MSACGLGGGEWRVASGPGLGGEGCARGLVMARWETNGRRRNTACACQAVELTLESREKPTASIRATNLSTSVNRLDTSAILSAPL